MFQPTRGISTPFYLKILEAFQFFFYKIQRRFDFFQFHHKQQQQIQQQTFTMIRKDCTDSNEEGRSNFPITKTFFSNSQNLEAFRLVFFIKTLEAFRPFFFLPHNFQNLANYYGTSGNLQQLRAPQSWKYHLRAKTEPNP